MDHATLFMMGIYLAPLAFVSFVSAWADGRKPIIGVILAAASTGLIAFVAYDRPEGLYALSDIPEMTTALIARMLAAF